MHRAIKKWQFFIGCWFWLSTTVSAQSLLQSSIPFDTTVRTGMLPNGIRYYLRHNPQPQGRAELQLAVRVGALQEDDDQLGIAHFVEHMAFNGTKRFPKNDLVRYLESTGMRFGADLNAYTSFAETVYMLQVRTDSLDLLQQGLKILCEWAQSVAFDSVEIDKERGVIISEWRSRLSPDQRMQQQYLPILYQNARHARRLPIGNPDLIATVKHDAVSRFYRDWYRPELMAVIAVGDFDPQSLEQLFREQFSGIEQKKDDVQKYETYSIPITQQTRCAIVGDPEAAFTTAQLIYRFPQTALRTRADYRTFLAAILYNRMLSARLFEVQQLTNPPFTFASAGYSRDIGQTDTYSVYAFTAEGKAIEGLRAVLMEIRRAQLYGFTATELERQKNELLKNAEHAYRERDKIASNVFANRYLEHFLYETPALDAAQFLDLYQTLLPTITLVDIQALSNLWLAGADRTFIVTGPQRQNASLLPAEAELYELLEEIQRATPLPYADQSSDQPLFNFNLTTVEILQRFDYDELGVTELKLKNNATVLLKPTDFKNNEILLSAFSPGGHSLYDDADYMNAANCIQIIDFSGLGEFDAVALQKKLAGKNASVSPYVAELFEGFNGTTTPEDIETLLQLIYLYFTAPRCDSVVLQSFVNRQRSITQNMMLNPYYYFNDIRSQIKYGNHPRRRMTQMKDLDQISLDGVYRIYKERFADASDFTFVFVGAFQTDSLIPLIAKYLGNLPTSNREETWRDIGATLVPGRIDTIVVQGQAPKSIVEMTWHGEFAYEEQRARYDFSTLLEMIRIRLRNNLREDKGGVYSVQVSGAPNRYPRSQYFITVTFQCEPQQADTLVTAVLLEIRQLQLDGATETEIQTIQEIQKQNRRKVLRENSYWIGQLVARYQNNLTLEDILYPAYEQVVNQLTTKDIQNAATRYFETTNFMKIVLLPVN